MGYAASIGLAIATTVIIPAEIQEILDTKFENKGKHTQLDTEATYYHAGYTKWPTLERDSYYYKLKDFLDELDDEQYAYAEDGDDRNIEEYGDRERFGVYVGAGIDIPV